MKALFHRIATLIPLIRPSDQRVSCQLPSLVRALHKIAPRKTVREVVSSSGDRRQWGVLTAAWIGVSERELMAAVSKELKLPFAEHVPGFSLISYSQDAEALLVELQRCAAVPVLDGLSIIAFIAVDPAEVRNCRLFTGTEELRVGCVTEILRVLGEVERELAAAKRDVLEAANRRTRQVCEKMLETVVREARSHLATSCDIVTLDGRTTYQFFTSNNQRASGNIHSSVSRQFLTYLCDVGSRAEVKVNDAILSVRDLGNHSNFRVEWFVKENSLAEPQPENVISINKTQNDSDKLKDSIEELDSQPQVTAQVSTVLLVDDNPMFCKVVERLLVKDGFAVVSTSHGEEGLQKLRSTPHVLPDLIVSDLHMPGMNGKEFLQSIKQDPNFADIPVIMLTSDDDPNAELALLDFGADAFVSKLKDPRVLCAHVKRLTARAEVKKAA